MIFGYWFDRETVVSMHKQVWTRSRPYYDGEDFYDVYDRHFGKFAYTDIRPMLKQLEAERTNSLKTWEMKQPLAAGASLEEASARRPHRRDKRQK